MVDDRGSGILANILRNVRDWLLRAIRVLPLLAGLMAVLFAILVALGIQILEFGGVISEVDYVVLATFGLASWLTIQFGGLSQSTSDEYRDITEEQGRISEGVEDVAKHIALLRTELGNPNFHQIPAAEIGGRLRALVSSAEEWMHQGGSGNWVRHNVIPTLFAARGHSPTFNAVLVDPGEASAVAAYEQYRTKTRPGDVPPLRTGVLATMYCLGWARAHSRLQPVIYLVRAYEPLRFDGSQEGLIATVGTHEDNGLWAAADTWYYRAKADALKELHGFGGYQVELPSNADLFPAEPTELELRDFYNNLSTASAAGGSETLETLRSPSESDIELLIGDVKRFIRACSERSG